MELNNFNNAEEQFLPNEGLVIEEEHEQEKKPTALAERMRALVPKFFDIKIEGAENLEEIPEGTHVVFLATHMSYFDMPIAIASVAEKYPQLKVAQASTHESFKQNSGGFLGRQLIGVENSFSVSYTGGKEGDGNAIFNPENFEKMKEGLEEGNAIVIAAYLETDYQEKQWRLPSRGGNGGVYLAHITPNTLMVPVAVDIHLPLEKQVGDPIPELLKRRFLGKIKTTVKIGKPIEPTQIENIDRFKDVLEKRKNGEQTSEDDRLEFSRIRKALRAESDNIMTQLAEMLPEEKRPKSNEAEENEIEV